MQALGSKITALGCKEFHVTWLAFFFNHIILGSDGLLGLEQQNVLLGEIIKKRIVSKSRCCFTVIFNFHNFAGGK